MSTSHCSYFECTSPTTPLVHRTTRHTPILNIRLDLNCKSGGLSRPIPAGRIDGVFYIYIYFFFFSSLHLRRADTVALFFFFFRIANALRLSETLLSTTPGDDTLWPGGPAHETEWFRLKVHLGPLRTQLSDILRQRTT